MMAVWIRVFVVLLFLTVMLLFMITPRLIHEHITPKVTDNLKSSNNVCKIPRYDPFDPSIAKFIRNWPKINCKAAQPELTYLDKNGFLRINASSIIGNVSCFLREAIRRESNDFNVTFGPSKKISEPQRLPYEFNIVKCVDRNGTVVYESGYAKAKEVPDAVSKKSRELFKNGRVNVLILFFESMSRLNFIRQLPKTSNFIKERAKGIVMEGLMKVGDNTLPNMLTFLSGYSMFKNGTDEALGPFWPDMKYFDSLPGIWKNFSQEGYVTVFAEDPSGTFNYALNGFKVPPTDYYLRPFWMAMELLKNSKRSIDICKCIGHVPKHRILLNYAKDVVVKMEKEEHAFFSFNFLSQISHDNINAIKVIDDEILEMLQVLEENNVFKNSLVVLMSDHGNRIDPIRSTVIGRVEERMPYLAVALPPALEHFRQALEANANVLTSSHDVREMLLDVAMSNLQAESKVLRYGFKGLSLLRPIPNNRTCREVGVPSEYCVCWTEENLNVSDPETKKSGEILVKLVNELLDQMDKNNSCARLTLSKVEGGQMLLPSQAVSGIGTGSTSVAKRLMVTVEPSKALLEGTLESSEGKVKLMGDVNRLNIYGNQSKCIDDRYLKLFCFCNDSN